MKGVRIGFGAALVSLALASSAQGAITVGSNLRPDLDETFLRNSCATPPCTLLNQGLPAGRLVHSPIDGVIVRWRLRQGANTAGPGALRVIRPNNQSVTPTMWTGIRSEPVTLPGPAGTYLFNSRLPISVGDEIGVDVPLGHSAMTYEDLVTGSVRVFDPPLADGGTLPASGAGAAELGLNADVEPDADKDGFGDETQDLCPTQSATQGNCIVAPAAGATGAQAAALAKCKKRKKLSKRARKRCKKKARRLPL